MKTVAPSLANASTTRAASKRSSRRSVNPVQERAGDAEAEPVHVEERKREHEPVGRA